MNRTSFLTGGDAAISRQTQNASHPDKKGRSKWPVVPLNEVIEINPRPGHDDLADDSLASFIPMRCVQEESGRFEPLGDRKVGEIRKGYTPFRDGDVIFAKVTPCMENGKAAVMKGLTNGIGFGSTEFFALRPKKGLEAEYLFHFILQSNFRRDAARNMTGAVGLRRVPKSYLEQQRIPLPSPDEQRQIVAEIEKQFTRLEAGVAALRRVQANLKRYRAAVLKAACEGRLVPTEAEIAKAGNRKSKFETGEELLVRILIERRQNWQGRGACPEPVIPDVAKLPALPQGWTWTTFDQITMLITKGSSPKWQGFNYCEEGIIFVRSENVRWGKLDLAGVAHLPAAFNEKERKSILHEGDVLLNLVGASIGRAAVATNDVAGGNVNQAVAVIRLVAKNTVNQSAMIWLNSTDAQKRIHAEKVDVARANFSLEDTRVLPFPLPPIAEQARIVQEVERRLSVVEALEAVVSANLQRAARLRQSILQKAFTGGLVPSRAMETRDFQASDNNCSTLHERGGVIDTKR